MWCAGKRSCDALRRFPGSRFTCPTWANPLETWPNGPTGPTAVGPSSTRFGKQVTHRQAKHVEDCLDGATGMTRHEKASVGPLAETQRRTLVLVGRALCRPTRPAVARLTTQAIKRCEELVERIVWQFANVSKSHRDHSAPKRMFVGVGSLLLILLKHRERSGRWQGVPVSGTLGEMKAGQGSWRGVNIERVTSPVRSPPVLWPNTADGPFEVRLLVQEVNEQMDCVGIEIRPAPGSAPSALLSSQLRKLPLGQMLDDARRCYLHDLLHLAAEYSEEIVVGQHDRAEEVGSVRPLPEIKLRRIDELFASHEGGRPSYDDAHYQEVADAYKAAFRAGDFPTKAVMIKFTVSKSAAAKWIRKCRDKGKLPPTTRGRASIEPVSETST